MTRSHYRLIVLCLGATSVLLAVASVGSALKARRVAGVTALECANDGVVTVALGGQVYSFAAALGATTVLSGKGGEAFGEITTVTRDVSGHTWVGDSRASELSEFDGSGRYIKSIGNRYAFGDGPFRVAARGTQDFVVSATMAHRVAILSRNGQVVGRGSVARYPNGIVALPDGRVAVAESGKGRLLLLSSTLNELADTSGIALDTYSSKRNIYDIAAGPVGKFYVTSCEGTEGDCDVLPEVGAAQNQRVATLGVVQFPQYDFSNDMWLVSGMCVLPSGSLLLGSDRVPGLFRFDDEAGGPPGPLPQNPAPVAIESLTGNHRMALGPHTWISRFGNATVQRAQEVQFQRRLALASTARWTRMGLWAVLGILLVFVALTRSLGATVGGSYHNLTASRLRIFWRELVMFNASAAAKYAATIIGAGAATTCLISSVLGVVVGLSAGTAVAFFVAQGPARNKLVRNRSADHAQRAVTIYFGPLGWLFPLIGPDETVRATYAIPRYASGQPARAHELLDVFLPRLNLIAMTERRIFIYACSIFGTPLEPIAVIDRRLGTGELEISRAHFRMAIEGSTLICELSLPSNHSLPIAHESIGKGRLCCHECGASAGPSAEHACNHQRIPVAEALFLGVLLPGLGHLRMREFRRARVILLMAAAQAAECFRWASYALTGVLPVAFWRYGAPFVCLTILWIGAQVDVRRLIAGRRSRQLAFSPRPTAIDNVVQLAQDEGEPAALLKQRLIHINAMSLDCLGRQPETWDSQLVAQHLDHMHSIGMSGDALTAKKEALAWFLTTQKRAEERSISQSLR